MTARPETLRQKVHHQLFVGAEPDGALTLTNKLLILVILLAVIGAAMHTEPDLPAHWQHILRVSEWVFGAIFLIEYCARVYSAADNDGPGSAWAKRWRFIRSPLGMIDLLVVVSTLVPVLTADASMLRVMRLLRVLAVMKFGRFNYALREIRAAVGERLDDLIVTFAFSGIILLLGATALYMTEGALQPEQFGSIPRALYWAAMTLTSVGYGDAVPITPLGKFFATIVAISGIAVIAMPTGILAAAFSDAMQRRRDHRIEDIRRHMEELAIEDDRLEAKLAALERAAKHHHHD